MSARVGVVGHVEWVEFARVARVPLAGEIVHASALFCEPAGGGAVAAVQLRRLAGAALLLTALGTGAEAEQASDTLRERHDVTVHAASRPGPQRRALTFLDDASERTIIVLGERIVPLRADPLPWESLAEFDAVYFTGGDAGAVRAARAARILVATPRAMAALAASGVRVDVLVGSAHDPGEVYERGMLDPEPVVVVRTRGGDGGTWELGGGAADAATGVARTSQPGERARGAAAPAAAATAAVPWLPAGERSGGWQAAPLPGPPIDAYGCGDTFAAALTYGLGAGMMLVDAIALAARCGAICLTGRGPYGAVLEPC